MVALTVLFIVPNILTAVFLSDFSHLGLVWPAFNRNLQAHPTSWAIVQGILAPLVQTLLYLTLPPIFRRLYTHSGDPSKTSRDRHVTSRLYAFFVFNNLVVFSIFGSLWKFIAAVVKAKNEGVWEAMKDTHPFTNLMIGLCNMSTFWLTWQMQRNLGAAVDLLQAWPLIWCSLRRKFMSPTPRELIELTAPQPFDYASYYNNFMFVATVGLCYGTLQPLILPITAFYIGIEVWWKKYLLQYVFITKNESGGVSWKLLVNRLLFAIILSNAVIALIVGANGVGSFNTAANGAMLYAMVPLPFLIWAFKWYAVRSFDDKLQFYSTRPFSNPEGGLPTPGTPQKGSNDRLAQRFGHPALYRSLITPMINSKAQHLLPDLYHGPISPSTPTTKDIRYTDSIPLSPMDPSHPGKSDSHLGPSSPTSSHHPYQSYGDGATSQPPHKLRGLSYEPVHSPAMSFDNFKNRPEFRDEFGGDGELYGRPGDPYSATGPGSSKAGSHYHRSGSRGSAGSSIPGSPTRVPVGGHRTGSQSPRGRGPGSRNQSPAGDEGTIYARGLPEPRFAERRGGAA